MTIAINVSINKLLNSTVDAPLDIKLGDMTSCKKKRNKPYGPFSANPSGKPHKNKGDGNIFHKDLYQMRYVFGVVSI